MTGRHGPTKTGRERPRNGERGTSWCSPFEPRANIEIETANKTVFDTKVQAATELEFLDNDCARLRTWFSGEKLNHSGRRTTCAESTRALSSRRHTTAREHDDVT